MAQYKLRTSFVEFMKADERGSATLWNLFWLLGFCSLLGVGLDTTAAMNTKARLQTVSDASAHAAVMDIFPIATDAVGTALDYGMLNNSKVAGVVTASDVAIGYWDRETRSFQTGDLQRYNAVRVSAARDTSRDNALATFFLKTVGFSSWEIGTVSTALYYDDLSLTDRCRKNGLFAGGTVEQTSNNTITGDYCVHGEGGIKISQNNVVSCGVEISLPDSSLWLNQAVTTPSGQAATCVEYDGSNLTSDQMIDQSVIFRSIPSQAALEYRNVKAILDAFVSGQAVNDPFNAIPPYITLVATIDLKTFNSNSMKLTAGTLYYVQCTASNEKLTLSGRIQNIGVYTNCAIDVLKDKRVSDIKPQKTTGNYDKNNLCDPDASTCDHVPWDAEFDTQVTCSQMIAALQADSIPDKDQFETYQTLYDTAGSGTYRDGVTQDVMQELCVIEPGANGLWDNVFVFTTVHEGGDLSQKAITFPNNMQIGRMDGCTEGGAARIYAAGSVDTPSGTIVHGSHFVLLGDAKLAAKADGVHGLNVEAAGNIQYSAQGQVGGCPGDEKDLASDVVVTVRTATIVN